MSIAVTRAVWERSRARGGARLVLLAIADFADDKGEAWPAAPTLAAKCRMSKSTVFEALAELRRIGELEIDVRRGPHRCNRYRVIVRNPDDPKSGPSGIRTGIDRNLDSIDRIPDSDRPESGPNPSRNHQGSIKGTTRGRKSRVADRLPPLPHPGPEFAEAWARWEQYRRELRKRLTPSTVKAQFEMLAKLSCADAIDAIDRSIRAGWQGIHPDERRPKAAPPPPEDEHPADSWIRRAEQMKREKEAAP